MAIEQRLQMKLATRLAMTPNLQLAIRLLQLNKLELQEVINKELLENPVLEEAPPGGDGEDVAAGELGREGEAPAAGAAETPAAGESPESAETPETADPADKIEEIDWDTFLTDEAPAATYREPREDRDHVPFENLTPTTTTLYDHLMWQLSATRTLPEERAVAEEIIGNLNDDGYLTVSVEEIARKTGTDTEFVEDVLSLVQEFDPLGVAARDIKECLLIQIAQSELKGTLVEEIVRHHLHRVERNAIPEIAKLLKTDVGEVQKAIEQLRRFEPKPGRQYQPSTSQYIVPDAYIIKVDDEYVVVLNEEGIPRLQVSRLYRKLLHSNSNTPTATRKYLEKKLKSALWLIRSVDQRQRTIYKVVKSILKFQRDFFDKGIAYLRPLVLREVADDIGVHESTVSRVSTNKYVHTPRGLFEIKFFFHSGLQGENGAEISSHRVKEIIKTLIAEEDPRSPLSDAKIARALCDRGIKIARRTVAKYREELKILPSSRRKVY